VVVAVVGGIAGFWIYNDLDRGFAEAKKADKPLLVVLRCVPCEECVKLDDDLVNQDRRVRPLLDAILRHPHLYDPGRRMAKPPVVQAAARKRSGIARTTRWRIALPSAWRPEALRQGRRVMSEAMLSAS
jgi:hypothetical protein